MMMTWRNHDSILGPAQTHNIHVQFVPRSGSSEISSGICFCIHAAMLGSSWWCSASALQELQGDRFEGDTGFVRPSAIDEAGSEKTGTCFLRKLMQLFFGGQKWADPRRFLANSPLGSIGHFSQRTRIQLEIDWVSFCWRRCQLEFHFLQINKIINKNMVVLTAKRVAKAQQRGTYTVSNNGLYSFKVGLCKSFRKRRSRRIPVFEY